MIFFVFGVFFLFLLQVKFVTMVRSYVSQDNVPSPILQGRICLTLEVSTLRSLNLSFLIYNKPLCL